MDEPTPAAEDSKEEVLVSMSIRRIQLAPQQPPKPIHKALFTALDNDMMLEVGFLDLRENFNLIQAARASTLPPGNHEVSFYVTDRYIITPESALELLRASQEMVKHFEGRGLIDPERHSAPRWLTPKE